MIGARAVFELSNAAERGAGQAAVIVEERKRARAGAIRKPRQTGECAADARLEGLRDPGTVRDPHPADVKRDRGRCGDRIGTGCR